MIRNNKFKFLPKFYYLIILTFLFNLSTFITYSQSFKNINKEVGLDHNSFDPMMMASGVAIFDYDNDGLEDFYMVSGVSIDHLYKNNGDGTFKNVTIQAGLEFTKGVRTTAIATGDYNNDGFRDIILGTGGNLPEILLKNNKDGTFTNVSKIAGITSKTFSFALTFNDFNQDGWLDIYVGNYGPSPNEPGLPNVLYQNNGDGTFTDVTSIQKVGDKGCTLGTIFSDIDNDNDLDLLVVNDFGLSQGPNAIFEYDSKIKLFKNISFTSGFNIPINGMGISKIDINEDGYFDYYLTNIRHNVLMVNQKNNTFLDNARNLNMTFPFIPKSYNPDLPSEIESTSWAALMYDYDCDSYTDVFVTTGHVISPYNYSDPDKVLKNIENKTFEDVSDELGFNYTERSRGAAMFDYDNDGDMDIIVNVVNIVKDGTGRSIFYRNNFQHNNNWLKVKLVGSIINRDAFGSRIKIYFGDRMLMKEVDGGGGTYTSQSSQFIHFGLAKNQKVDSIEVIWLGGDKKTLKNVNTNQTITIVQDYKLIENITICKGSEFLGQIIGKSTSIKKTFTAKNGADSIVTFNIEVIEPIIKNIDLSVCVGTIFYNITILNDTLITKKYFAFSGCDSLVNFQINTLATPTFKEEKNLCYGENFRNIPQFQSDTFIEKIKSEDLCDSIYICYLYVENKNETNIIYYLDENRLYQNVYYPTDTTLAFTYQSYKGCDSLVNISLKTPLSIENNNNELFEIKVYPTLIQANENLFIDINIQNSNLTNNLLQINIFDILGSKIYYENKIIQNGFNHFEISEFQKLKNELSSNNYLLNIQFNNVNRNFLLKILK